MWYTSFFTRIVLSILTYYYKQTILTLAIYQLKLSSIFNFAEFNEKNAPTNIIIECNSIQWKCTDASLEMA